MMSYLIGELADVNILLYDIKNVLKNKRLLISKYLVPFGESSLKMSHGWK